MDQSHLLLDTEQDTTPRRSSLNGNGIMDWKHPITLIVIAAVVIVGLYFLMSPYQNCMREEPPGRGKEYSSRWDGYCRHETSW